MKPLFGRGKCENCGTSMTMFNSSKVEKGYICKECMKNVSCWFDKENASYQTMVEHIKQRIQNKEALTKFSPTISYGDGMYFYIDAESGTFLISSSSDYNLSNMDVFNLEDIISCEKRIEEKKEELKYRDRKGNLKKVIPQFMAHQFDFYIDVHLKMPGYGKIPVKINDRSIDNGQDIVVSVNISSVINVVKDVVKTKSLDGIKTNNREEVLRSDQFRKYDEMCDSIIKSLSTKNIKKTHRCPYCDSIVEVSDVRCVSCGAAL